jgi:hypothetical protein
MRRLLALLLFAAPLFAQTATFVKTDTTTQGNWSATYGHDGESIWDGTVALPSYATLAAQNASNWVWATGSSDPRTLNGIAGCWYSPTSFTFQLALTGTHQVSFYLMDWDTWQGGRIETILISSGGTVLASQQFSKFTGGVYAVFDISGSVTVTVTNNNSASNAVVNGVFFDPAPGPKLDSVTLSWTASPTAGATYTVYRNGTQIASGLTATTYTDATMVSGQTYTYTVAAAVGGVLSAQAAVTAFVAP